jgi:hypothetical protein
MEERRSMLVPVVAAVLLALMLVYLGGYLVLVNPQLAQRGVKYPYRFGREYSTAIFWPLEQLDRRIRPNAWFDPFSE